MVLTDYFAVDEHSDPCLEKVNPGDVVTCDRLPLLSAWLTVTFSATEHQQCHEFKKSGWGRRRQEVAILQ